MPQAFCDDLKKVVASAAGTKFNSILGPQHSGIWTARIQLPGWEDCTVRDWTYEGTIRRYYSCVLRSFAGIAEMDTMMTALQAYVKPCLGPDWPSGAAPSLTGRAMRCMRWRRAIRSCG